MKYIKTYENKEYEERELLRKKSIRKNYIVDQPHSTFDLYSLLKDCCEYKIDIFDLIKEMLLNKKITFQCTWCYDNNKKMTLDDSHNIIGKCIDVDFDSYDNYYNYSDILVKIENFDGWHTILVTKPKRDIKQKVRIYNYTEGNLMKHINMLKNMNKYNL